MIAKIEKTKISEYSFLQTTFLNPFYSRINSNGRFLNYPDLKTIDKQLEPLGLELLQKPEIKTLHNSPTISGWVQFSKTIFNTKKGVIFADHLTDWAQSVEPYLTKDSIVLETWQALATDGTRNTNRIQYNVISSEL